MKIGLLTCHPAVIPAVHLTHALMQADFAKLTVVTENRPLSFLPLPESREEERDLDRYRRFLADRPHHDAVIERYPTLHDLRRDVAFDLANVDDLNDDACEALLSSLALDLIVLAGAPLLRRGVYGRATLGAVNFHSGLTPWYRGTSTIFRALQARDVRRVGFTIHLVDDGVDTGDIVHQETVQPEAHDSERALLARCARRAGAALVDLVGRAHDGQGLARRRCDSRLGRTYRGLPTPREHRELADFMESDGWSSLVEAS